MGTKACLSSAGVSVGCVRRPMGTFICLVGNNTYSHKQTHRCELKALKVGTRALWTSDMQGCIFYKHPARTVCELWAPFYCCDLTLSQTDHPMAVQLSLEAALSLVKETASDRRSNIGFRDAVDAQPQVRLSITMHRHSIWIPYIIIYWQNKTRIETPIPFTNFTHNRYFLLTSATVYVNKLRHNPSPKWTA